MSDLLTKLQFVKDAKTRVQARMDVNAERLAEISKELANHGVDKNVDLDALELALAGKLKTFDEQLTAAEEAIKSHTNKGASSDQSTLSKG